MTTVFQTFFVSYLVEPGFGKKMTRYEEAMGSDLIYAYFPIVDLFIAAMDYSRYRINLPESRRLACLDMVECTKRLITQRDVLIISSYIYVQYIASLIGISDYNKAICHIDETFALYATFLLPKTSPFFDGIERHLRQCLESGLFEKIWADTVLGAHLQSMGKNELLEDTTGTYFVFKIRHLTAAFLILTLGHILSCTVFALEIIQKRLSVSRHQLHDASQRHPNF
jgi:hypothetical protein